MRAHLKQIVSPDVEALDTFRPDDPTRFLIPVILSIGLEGTDAADDFSTMICSARSLAALAAENKVLAGQAFIIAETWDFPLIRERIAAYCASCEGETWEDILPMLTRLGVWEFENFEDDEPARA